MQRLGRKAEPPEDLSILIKASHFVPATARHEHCKQLPQPPHRLQYTLKGDGDHESGVLFTQFVTVQGRLPSGRPQVRFYICQFRELMARIPKLAAYTLGRIRMRACKFKKRMPGVT